ncbi:rhamnogalacturonan endolyase family protein [Aquifex sp.]
MRLFLLLLLLSLTSCGIKSEPKPLPEPEFRVKRVGEFVYVIGSDLEVPGFQKVNGFWVVHKKESFCFHVKRVKGKEKKVCVSEAVKIFPNIKVQEHKDVVRIIPQEGETFRLYRVKGDIPIPPPLKEFTYEISVNKTYSKYRVAVTKVLKENLESYPTYVEIPPKPKPVPEPPYDAGYFRLDKKIVIYWFHNDFENLKGFNVYKNGEKVNDEPLKKNTFVDNYPEESTVYEIRAVNRFGVESKGITISLP